MDISGCRNGDKVDLRGDAFRRAWNSGKSNVAAESTEPGRLGVREMGAPTGREGGLEGKPDFKNLHRES